MSIASGDMGVSNTTEGGDMGDSIAVDGKSFNLVGGGCFLKSLSGPGLRLEL